MGNRVQVDIKVAQLLCSRLCHDLAGPAGAIHNGMEVLQEYGGDGGAMAVIANSAGQLNRQLGFYRIAFGLGGLSGRKPAFDEARELASDFLNGGRTRLDWPGDFPRAGGSQFGLSMSGEAIKLLLNMILFGAGTLPKGGILAVKFEAISSNPAGIGLTVTASGQGAFIKDNLLAALFLDSDKGDADTVLSAHNVQVFFMQRLAESLGGKIKVSGNVNEAQIATFLQN